MCKENRDYFIALLVALLLCSAWGVLHGQESSENWYLISAPELQRLEQISISWEQDRLSWLSQVRGLKADSVISNDLLMQERETTQRLRISSERSAAEQLTKISLKNGEIANVKADLAAAELREAKSKGQAAARLVMVIALGAAWVLFIAYKVCRFFRVIP